MMSKILSWQSSLLISITIVALSLACSVQIWNFDIFASSGAVVTVFGIYQSFSHTLLFSKQNKHNLIANKLGYALLWPDKDQDEILYEKARKILLNEKVGFGLSIVGTLIWAYGGYIKS